MNESKGSAVEASASSKKTNDNEKESPVIHRRVTSIVEPLDNGGRNRREAVTTPDTTLSKRNDDEGPSGAVDPLQPSRLFDDEYRDLTRGGLLDDRPSKDESLRTMLAATEVIKTYMPDSSGKKKRAESTKHYYEEVIARLRRRAIDENIHGPSAIEAILSPYAGNANSWKVIKSALKYHYTKVIAARSLAVVNKMKNDTEVSWNDLRALQNITGAVCTLQTLSRQDCLSRTDTPARRAKSKRLDLNKLPGDWRIKFEQENRSSPKYKLAGVLLSACGMRPVELENGVSIEIRDGQINVKIIGGKVNEIAGQPWREMTLNPKKLPDWFLDEVRKSAQPVVVKCQRDALGAHLERVGKKLFKKDASNKSIRISAYLFRHALATDLRESDWTEEEIAQVLGEVTTDTTKYYGARRSGRRPKANTIAIDRTSMKTARPVKIIAANDNVKFKGTTRRMKKKAT